MLDTRKSGIEYSREELASFPKIADLFTNDNRCIYAELLSDDSTSRKVYFREWLASNDASDSCSFCVVNSLQELKEELKKDTDHGDLAPGKMNKICDAIRDAGIFGE